MWNSYVIDKKNGVLCKQFCDTEKLYLKKMNSLVKLEKS